MKRVLILREKIFLEFCKCVEEEDPVTLTLSIVIFSLVSRFFYYDFNSKNMEFSRYYGNVTCNARSWWQLRRAAAAVMHKV